MPGTAIRRVVLLVAASLLLTACSSTDVSAYRDRQPQFVPEEFFRGPLTAHGILKDRSGRVTRTFNAQLKGSWNNGEGLLEERFVFDDGEVQFRDWRLVPTGADSAGVRTFSGTAGDVIGPAKVRVSGNAMFIRYTLQVPWKGDTIEVDVDDRMYLVSDRVLINESSLSKWGFNVGEIVLTIIRGQQP
ncbi:DUF3833 domain-containing protein [Microbulbifer sp. YPW16]|uniref:DUF3833 domain-containing protein n=1 Tax=Microbulbifer sp. YPW16 TaxID=2904242 RepID=UPI001E448C68|nr:DUF3833 domain-containing protein [Microbulbifer sp. YPW16]UHQ54245.1 DUF3833 domain-containing protein [Microbulbifer sp. YPW16]